jgi:hypothetical protein
MSELYIVERIAGGRIAEELTRAVDFHARAAFRRARVPFANLFSAQQPKPL